MKAKVTNATLPDAPAPGGGIPPANLGKISVSLQSEADHLAQIPESALRQVGEGITRAYLSQLNRYALENGLISQEEYQKMEVGIRGGGATGYAPPNP